LESFQNAFELVKYQEGFILMHVGLHVLCDRLQGYHQRFFNPNVEVRVIDFEFASTVWKNHLNIAAWFLVSFFTRNWQLLLANHKSKSTHQSVNSVVDIFVQ